MKLLILCALLLTLASPLLSQQINTASSLLKADYLRKSKHQKTAAWILTSAGAVGLLGTLVVDMSQVAEGLVITIGTLGMVEPKYKSYTVPYLLSTASLLGGVTLFIAASKNKKKAAHLATLPYLKTERASVLQRTGIGTQRYPAVAVRVCLSR